MSDSLSAIDELIQSLCSDDYSTVNAAANALVERGAETLPSLFNLLHDADKSLRDTISWIMVEIGTPAVAPAIQLLKDGAPAQQSMSAEVLGTIAAPESIEPLIDAMRAESPEVREAVAWALVQVGEQTVPYIIDFIRNESSYFRDTALWVLSGIGEPAISSMVTALSPGKNRQNQFITDTLADMGEPAMEHLHALLCHEDADIRRCTVTSLGRISNDESVSHILPLMNDADRDVRSYAVQALSQMGTKICSHLCEMITTDDDVLLDSIFMVICNLGQDVSHLLVKKLTDADVHLRRRIVRALGIIRDPSTVDTLINCLKDPDNSVKDIAAWALGELGDIKALEPLIASLQDESLGINFSLAPWALGKLHAVESVDRLISLLESPFPGIRWKAALGLGLLKDFRATPPLLKHTNDESPEVKRRIISSLGDLLDPAAIEPLRELLLTDDGSCQIIIKDALKRIKCGEPAVKDPFS